MGSSKELGISTSARKASNNIFVFSHATNAFFASPCFPALSIASKVWDNFLVEGWKVVYRVFIAILASCEQDLLNLQFEHVLSFLRDKLPSRIDGQTILSASLGVRLRSRHIRKYTKEFRTMQSQENFKSRRSSSGSSGVKNVKQRGKDLVRKLTVGS